MTVGPIVRIVMSVECASELEMLDRAFQLAFFIHPDRSIALAITKEAMDGVETIAAVQKRRRYYRPIGRQSNSQARRDRIILARPHLLQQLIFCESEPFELEQESNTGSQSPTEEDMAVRFIGYLVRISLSRNALHTAVGLGRLLYNLETEETVKLYDLVVQDPERFCSSDYLRSRKRVLLGEVLRRFGSAIRVQVGFRGEKRLETAASSKHLVDLAATALEKFTPWGTDCVVPAECDPEREPIPGLAFKGSNPDDEHLVEIRRIHALLHPGCLARLTRSLGLENVMSHLALPRFFMNLDSGDSSGDRGSPVSLTPDERRTTEETLRRRRGRRRRFRPGMLTIRIDGREVGRIDHDRTRKVNLQVEEFERLEVFGQDSEGSLRLATWMPGFRGLPGQPANCRANVPLGSGAELRFAMTPDETGAKWLVDIEFHRPVYGLGALMDTAMTLASARLRLATAVMALLVTLLSIGLFVRQTPAPSDSWPPPGPADRPLDLGDSDISRGSSSSPGLALDEVRSIFFKVTADDVPGELWANLMMREFLRIERFRALDSLSNVDAVLEITVLEDSNSFVGSEDVRRVKLALVNRAGEVLWRHEDRGTAQEIVQRVRMDLVTQERSR